MEWWEVAFWGSFGGFIVDGIEFWKLLRNNRGSVPLAYQSVAFVVAEGIRLAASAGLATALERSGHISGPIGAMAIGAATPLLVEKLTQQLPTFSSPEQEEPEQEDHK